MKARIRFQKYGMMKFIGHLDIMRYFQKAFRRANIDSEYTKGFSPHQIMSFASPLGVGLTSDSEYVDVQLFTSDTPEIMIERLNTIFTEGIHVTGFHELLEQIEHQKVVTAMSLVASSDYLVSLKDGYAISASITTQEEFQKAFEQYTTSVEIFIDKKTKASEKAVDIRPMISLVAFNNAEYLDKLRKTLQDEESVLLTEVRMQESVAEEYKNEIKVYLQLDTGSSINLKPELVMEAFYDYLGLTFEKFAWQVHRLEIYTRNQESGKLQALDQVER